MLENNQREYGNAIYCGQSQSLPTISSCVFDSNVSASGIGSTSGGAISGAANTLLVKYTYVGDANLDGHIDGDDYFALNSHILQSSHVFGYASGDINYDGNQGATITSGSTRRSSRRARAAIMLFSRNPITSGSTRRSSRRGRRCNLGNAGAYE